MVTTEQLVVALSELGSESDRNVAIIGVALLETIVDDLVRSRLRVVGAHNAQQKDFEKVLMTFIGRNGPIDTYRKQVTLLFLLGTISEWGFRDLRKLADIRNYFAHQIVHDIKSRSPTKI